MKTLKPQLENQTFKKHYVYWVFGSAFFPPYANQRQDLLFAKVGIADDVRKRIEGMQTDCPVVIHTVLGIPCPSKREAVVLENVFKRTDELECYNSKGEWFIVSGGPRDHVSFLTRLIAQFYIHRNSHAKFLDTNIEWIASPFTRHLRELVPEAGDKMLTVSQEARTQKREFEIESLVDAEIKTKALVECWYQPEKKLKQAYLEKQAHMKSGAAHLDLPLRTFPMKQQDWKNSWFYTDGRSDFWDNM